MTERKQKKAKAIELTQKMAFELVRLSRQLKPLREFLEYVSSPEAVSIYMECSEDGGDFENTTKGAAQTLLITELLMANAVQLIEDRMALMPHRDITESQAYKDYVASIEGENQ